MTAESNIPKLETAAVGNPITRVGVSFFPVYLFDNPLPEITTGDSSGLVIEELDDAQIPTLSAYNPTKKPVLIVEGEHFLGGKQNRTINVTVLLAAMKKTEIPVSCLEQGRWGRRRAYARARSHAPSRVRAAKLEGVNMSMQSGGSRHGDQRAVWGAVNNVLNNLNERSETAAASDADAVYDREGALAAAARDLAARGPLSGQCGLAVSCGSRLTAIELFGAPDLLKAHWSPLVRSHLLERPVSEGRASARAVLSLIRRLGWLSSKNSPGVGLGVEQHVKDKRVVAQALTLEGSVVHCSAFTRNGSGTRRPRRRY